MSKNEIANAIARRQFLHDCGIGLGKVAAASLLTGGFNELAKAESQTLAVREPHHAPSAKAVIHLFMAGAPSHLDLFDHKPELSKFEGKPLPESVIQGQRYAFIRPDAAVMGPRFPFGKHGESNLELANAFQHLPKIADDICVMKSVYTDQFNHAPAQIFFNSGFLQPGRPSLGSWVLYGLGAETQELPAYVVMSTGAGISGGAANWSSGFLPTLYTGVRLRNEGDPILNIQNPSGIDSQTQSETIETINRLNQRRLDDLGDPEIATRMANYEMAFRLQTSAPDLMNLRTESQETLSLYGCDPDKPSFSRACLLARRMVERGVRFINIYHEGWDAHSDIVGNHTNNLKATEQGAVALVQDLKRLGLLDTTLVVWGGEFGRTPMIESNASLGRANGRDHHPQAFTMWMAGGGMKAGFQIGQTDDFGFRIVENPIHVHDIQATILHTLGLNHERLTFRHAGREFRLTDVHGRVVREVLQS